MKLGALRPDAGGLPAASPGAAALVPVGDSRALARV
jgi:hypothetical protein